MDFKKLVIEMGDQKSVPFTKFVNKKTQQKITFWEFIKNNIQSSNFTCKLYLLLTPKEEQATEEIEQPSSNNENVTQKSTQKFNQKYTIPDEL